MTEEEWNGCRYPSLLLRQPRRRGFRSTRKLRLAGCACCRRVWGHLSDRGRRAVEVSESAADGEAGAAELESARPAYLLGDNIAGNALHYLAAPNRLFRSWIEDVLNHAAWAVAEQGPRHDAERLAQSQLLRDVLGNPFRPPAAIEPAWLTWHHGTVRALAEAAYRERVLPSGELDRHRLAVLADALEEAGCADVALLGHLQSPGPHVRGCFAVDLLTGRG